MARVRTTVGLDDGAGAGAEVGAGVVLVDARVGGGGGGIGLSIGFVDGLQLVRTFLNLPF